MVPYAGKDCGEWRDDPQNAPRGERLLAWAQGGITIRIVDDNGQWRGQSGKPLPAPAYWQLGPEPPEPRA